MSSIVLWRFRNPVVLGLMCAAGEINSLHRRLRAVSYPVQYSNACLALIQRAAPMRPLGPRHLKKLMDILLTVDI